jgi:hypothetical protein
MPLSALVGIALSLLILATFLLLSAQTKLSTSFDGKSAFINSGTQWQKGIAESSCKLYSTTS